MVQMALSRTYRTCSYDRTGLGSSPPSKVPLSVGQDADDLAQMLMQAKLPAPYLMVGHSLAGLILWTYAVRHPDQVHGLVLVAPASEGEDGRFAGVALGYAEVYAKAVQAARDCLAAMPEPATRSACSSLPPAAYPPAQRLVAWRMADATRGRTSARETIDRAQGEWDNLLVERHPLPIPLIILSRGRAVGFGRPPTPEFQGALLNAWRQM